MLEVSRFKDWNPSHFLDTGKMAMAVAIGYDWLFDELSGQEKQILRKALVEKAITPSFNPSYNWFLNSSMQACCMPHWPFTKMKRNWPDKSSAVH